MPTVLCPRCGRLTPAQVAEYRDLSDPGGGVQYVRASCRNPACSWSDARIFDVPGLFRKTRAGKKPPDVRPGGVHRGS